MSVLPACDLAACVERRHESGLEIICPDRFEETSEELKAAASFAMTLAEEHPDDFGYPWPDAADGQLDLRIASPRGEDVTRMWLAGEARRAASKEPREIPAPDVPIRRVMVDRSVRALSAIQHDVMPAPGLPDGDAIYMTGPDHRRNVIVITVDRLSTPLLHALAARYGTSAIAISVNAARPRLQPGGR